MRHVRVRDPAHSLPFGLLPLGVTCGRLLDTGGIDTCRLETGLLQHPRQLCWLRDRDSVPDLLEFVLDIDV